MENGFCNRMHDALGNGVGKHVTRTGCGLKPTGFPSPQLKKQVMDGGWVEITGDRSTVHIDDTAPVSEHFKLLKNTGYNSTTGPTVFFDHVKNRHVGSRNYKYRKPAPITSSPFVGLADVGRGRCPTSRRSFSTGFHRFGDQSL